MESNLKKIINIKKWLKTRNLFREIVIPVFTTLAFYLIIGVYFIGLNPLGILNDLWVTFSDGWLFFAKFFHLIFIAFSVFIGFKIKTMLNPKERELSIIADFVPNLFLLCRAVFLGLIIWFVLWLILFFFSSLKPKLNFILDFYLVTPILLLIVIGIIILKVWFCVFPEKEHPTPRERTSEYYSEYSELKQPDKPVYVDYKDYITNSPVWQEKRQQKLMEANYTCELCKDSGAHVELHIHHKRYKDTKGKTILGREKMSDLLCVCKECHEKIHPKKDVEDD